jgi:hypothetical protein
MLQEPFENRSSISVWIKLLLCIWMGAVIFIFLIMFGPPEFWSIGQGLGIYDGLMKLQGLLTPFFTAGYLS